MTPKTSPAHRNSHALRPVALQWEFTYHLQAKEEAMRAVMQVAAAVKEAVWAAAAAAPS